jgi:hypothetical protein
MKSIYLAALLNSIILFSSAIHAATFAYFESDPDSIGRGDSATVTSFDEVTASSNKNNISFSFRAASQVDPKSTKPVYYHADFHLPAGKVLLPGIYRNAQRFSSSINPGLDVSGYYGCNDGFGEFTVLEADFDLGNFAIDFEYTCMEGPTSTPETGSFRGVLRVNSDIPKNHDLLIAYAGVDQYRNEGDTVLLSGAGSDSGTNTIVDYQWTQTSGTQVSLSQSASSSDVEFILPEVNNLSEDLVFTLTVTNNLGQKSTDTVTIHATNLNGPKNYIRFYNGTELVKEFTLNDVRLWALCLKENSSVSYCDSAYRLDFSFEGQGGLRVDFMVFSPGIGVDTLSQDYGYCQFGQGDQTIIEVLSMVENPNIRSSLSSFAADITQNCPESKLDGGLPYTKIEYRLNTLYPASDKSNTVDKSAGAINIYFLLIFTGLWFLSRLKTLNSIKHQLLNHKR